MEKRARHVATVKFSKKICVDGYFAAHSFVFSDCSRSDRKFIGDI